MFTQFHKSCAYAQAKKLKYLMDNLMRSKFFSFKHRMSDDRESIETG